MRIPEYFSADYLQRGALAGRDSWPSLFVGANGTRSALHVDRGAGNACSEQCIAAVLNVLSAASLGCEIRSIRVAVYY